MRIGITVNDIASELVEYTSTHLAMTATNMGHEVWYINVGDFSLQPDDHTAALARTAPAKHYRSASVYLHTLTDREAHRECICVDDLDILLLRNDPSLDISRRPWARSAAIDFGRMARQRGVIVLNDPDGLAVGLTKLYLQYFPEIVRPRTLVSRNREQLKAFIKAEGGRAVLKPLSGSGGRNVFLVQPEDTPNINQMIEAIARDNYVIAQEYLPEAVRGDTRLFLMNGRPLKVGGKYAAIHRARKTGDGDMRSNLSAGAVATRAQVTQQMLELAESVRPKLVADGMFLVGLDVVGDKLMEINVQSPGGLHSAGVLEDRNFIKEVVHALERKAAYARDQQRVFDNVALATL
jgi:glutathione synthase